MESPKHTLIGSHRSALVPAALDPSLVALDDHSPDDLLRQARQLARQLRYMGLDDAQGSTWEQALENAQRDWSGMFPEGDEALSRAFRSFLAAPETYQPAPDGPLSVPHRALYMAFLRILGQARAELNEFPRRHLDHYYRKVLGLQPRAARPGDAHVLLSLAQDAPSTFIPTGTTLLAEIQDGQVEVEYATALDIEVGQSRIDQLLSLRADYTAVGLRHMAATAGMAAVRAWIWEMGVRGRLAQWQGFDHLLADMGNRDRRRAFPSLLLQLSLDEFRLMMELEIGPEGPDAEQEEWMIRWETLHARLVLLRVSGQENPTDIINARRLIDKLQAALNQGQPFPFYRTRTLTLGELHHDVEEPADIESYRAASAYLREVLYLTEEEFCLLQHMDEGRDGIPKMPSIIREAMIRKASAHAPELVRRVTRHLQASTDARGNKRVGAKSWLPYGMLSSADTQPHRPTLVLASELLSLAEGERTVRLTLRFKPMHFHALASRFNMSAPAKADWTGPFQFLLSGEKEWLPIDWRQQAPRFFPEGHSVSFSFHLDATQPAITRPGEKFEDPRWIGQAPLLQIVVDDTDGWLAQLQLWNVDLDVEVEGIRAFQAQNHDGNIKVSAPFLPFGGQPGPGSVMMIAHPEICFKPLKALQLDFEWLGKPNDLDDYYAPYFVKMGSSPAENGQPYGDQGMAAWVESKSGPAPERLSEVAAPFMVERLSVDLPATSKGLEMQVFQSPDWIQPSDWPRYIQLSWGTIANAQLAYENAQRRLSTALTQASFAYANAATAYAASATAANKTRLDEAQALVEQLSTIVLPPPYVPRLKQMSIGYKAGQTIQIESWEASGPHSPKLIHALPFGYKTLLAGRGVPVPFLPRHDGEGSLFIGVAGATPEARLSFLLKAQPGTGMPDVAPPDVRLHYLGDQSLRPVSAGNLLVDETSGFTQSGIWSVALPKQAVNGSTQFPNGYHWVELRVERNPDALPDWSALHLHATRLVPQQQADGPSWDSLPSGSLKRFKDAMPMISTIEQPYDAAAGRPSEDDASFNRRVSERLRHRNRAIAAWDYERICLEQFPSVYAAKTLQAKAAVGSKPGMLSIVVVPDLRQHAVADPFQPKFDHAELQSMARKLRSAASPFAKVDMRNPQYRPVMVAAHVNFRDGLSGEIGKHLLHERLKRFLAPWAFDDATPLAFGGKLHVSQVVEVIQAEPYVDFVGRTRLFIGGADGKYREAIQGQHDSSAYVEAGHTEVLCAAQNHIITEIVDDSAKDEIWQGVSWMVIGQDFEVTDDPNDNAETYNDWVGISWTVIGKDFKVQSSNS